MVVVVVGMEEEMEEKVVEELVVEMEVEMVERVAGQGMAYGCVFAAVGCHACWKEKEGKKNE